MIFHDTSGPLYFHNSRLDIQQRVRRLRSEPRQEDQLKMDKQRETLMPLMAELTRLQGAANVFEAQITDAGKITRTVTDWDDAEVEEVGAAEPAHPVPSVLPVENRTLCLPSNGNTDPQLMPNELEARKRQALRHLNRIRELIAEKSFQYSAIMRHAPTKGVKTRSQSVVSDLNKEISRHSLIYRHCRCRMILLGADQSTLQQFRDLTKDDVTASTAVLKPNLPGASSLRLSWIWKSVNRRFVADADDTHNSTTDPATVLECLCNSIQQSRTLISPFFLNTVKRVHWLRARAQYQRWREECILVGYEMQWTVRYFLNKSSLWKPSALPDADPEFATPGAAAYANRQATMWHRLALIADKSFKYYNVHYQPVRAS